VQHEGHRPEVLQLERDLALEAGVAPAGERVVDPQPPSVDLSLRSQATSRGIFTYSMVEASSTSPGKSLAWSPVNSSGSRVGQIQWPDTRTSYDAALTCSGA
jgi:hypothetical protein